MSTPTGKAINLIYGTPRGPEGERGPEGCDGIHISTATGERPGTTLRDFQEFLLKDMLKRTGIPDVNWGWTTPKFPTVDPDAHKGKSTPKTLFGFPVIVDNTSSGRMIRFASIDRNYIFQDELDEYPSMPIIKTKRQQSKMKTPTQDPQHEAVKAAASDIAREVAASHASLAAQNKKDADITESLNTVRAEIAALKKREAQLCKDRSAHGTEMTKAGRADCELREALVSLSPPEGCVYSVGQTTIVVNANPDATCSGDMVTVTDAVKVSKTKPQS